MAHLCRLARAHFRAGAVPRPYRLDGPQWQVRLGDRVTDEGPGRVLTPTASAQRLTTHPVIAGDQVMVADAHSVTAYDLVTGRRLGEYDLGKDLQPAHSTGTSH